MNARGGFELDASLTISIDDLTAQVHAEGGDLKIRFRSFREALALFRRVSRSQRHALLDVLRQFLDHTRTTVSFEIGRERVAVAETRGRGGWLERVLGLGQLEIRWGALFRSASPRRSR